ncbi:hypothetical protein [Tunturiibacter lichenicola]|uniref:hypothetical protein n=1 Tax=Tunturiibacter lichenicola TaxID=2051959 RepID=UPI003D9AC436
MFKYGSLKNLFRKPDPEVSGISVLFLQKKLERFSDEQLSLAMQRGWGKKYDSTNFYGMSTFDGEGGLLKYNAMFFPFQHFERRVDAGEFGESEIPVWAEHNAYTSFGYRCPGGIPAGEVRDKMYWLIGRFCSELLGDNTQALLFVEDQIVLRYDSCLINEFRSVKKWNPEQLAAAQPALKHNS